MRRKEEEGGSTKMLEEVGCRQEFEETEEMVRWRSISINEMSIFWKEVSGRMEEEVLEKYNVQQS